MCNLYNWKIPLTPRREEKQTTTTAGLRAGK